LTSSFSTANLLISENEFSHYDCMKRLWNAQFQLVANCNQSFSSPTLLNTPMFFNFKVPLEEEPLLYFSSLNFAVRVSFWLIKSVNLELKKSFILFISDRKISTHSNNFKSALNFGLIELDIFHRNEFFNSFSDIMFSHSSSNYSSSSSWSKCSLSSSWMI